MKFVDKQLAFKLKEKGFDRPCFGYYYIKTPIGATDGALVLNRYPLKEGTYNETRKRHINEDSFPNIVDAPTIEEVLEWLRDKKDIDVVIYPIDRNTIFMGGENYILSVYIDRKRDYKVHQDNIDKYVKWEDACIAGIEYVINNLI